MLSKVFYNKPWEVILQFRFKTNDLKELYMNEKCANKYLPEVIDSFFEVMSVIAAANDERDLYKFRSYNFEKLRGNREGEYSIRLNKKWRLIFSIEKDEEGKWLILMGIENHYR